MTPPVKPGWQNGAKSNQEYIHNTWMTNFQTTNGIPSPFKHPDAVNDAIMDLKEGAPGNFIVIHDVPANKGKVLNNMLYWIKRTDYPGVTMKSGYHWVLVYAFETDAEPTLNGTVNLQKISIIDPSCSGCTDPAIGGVNIPDISGEAWASNYWDQGVNLWAGKPYHGEYVAVVEPPLTKGTVKIKKAYVGKKEEIISVKAAMEKAVGYIRERKLTQHKVLMSLAKASPQTALLVEWPDRERFYYVVPFVIERGGPAEVVMILNAYNGNYLECGALCKSHSFVLKDEAIRLILKRMRLKKYEKLTASLKYSYSNLTCSHYYPFWEINVDGKLYYVDPNRKLQTKLVPIHKLSR